MGVPRASLPAACLPACSGVHSDPLLTWVSGQLMQQQGSQGEQALGPAPEASAESLGSPAAGSSEALSTPTAGEVERQASGESQAAAGSNTALARPPGAGTSSRRRSSGWVGLDASRSSGLVDLKPWQLKYSELRIQRPLGEGSFGKVSESRGQPAAARVTAWAALSASPAGSADRWWCFDRGTHPCLERRCFWRPGTRQLLQSSC